LNGDRRHQQVNLSFLDFRLADSTAEKFNALIYHQPKHFDSPDTIENV
jgi:hypothetical protein